MKKMSHLFITTLAGALLLAGGACSSKPGSTTGTGGTNGLGGNSGVAGDPLVSSDTGFVSDPAVTGVVGAWYVYADSAGPNANVNSTDFADSHCMIGGFTAAQCSMTMPTAGQTFPPTNMATSQMCTSGTASKVVNGTNGMPDYSDLWGAGIGLDFNNPGGDAGVKGDFDMTPYTGVAFDFSGTTIPTNSMRVNFPFDGENGGSDSPYWEGVTMAYSPLTVGAPPAVQHVTIHWADVGGPMYLVGQGITPPAFNIKKVQSIQFQVFTNTTSASPYNFCVANLALLTD
jgi:hypothetical protein